jgi:hypothetical protein
LFPVVDSGVVVVTLALFTIDVGEPTVGDPVYMVTVAVPDAANVPREAVTVSLLSEHVPTVVVQAMNGKVPGSRSVTVTLSAGSDPAFVIVITKPADVPDVSGFGTPAMVRTRSGSAKAAGMPALANSIKVKIRADRAKARWDRKEGLFKDASNALPMQRL